MSTEKPSRNEDEYFARQDADLIKSTRALELAKIQEEARRQHLMKCPKDGYDLTTRELHGVQIEFCPHCGGFWLDKGELAVVMEREDKTGLLGRIVKDLRATLTGSMAKEKERE
ncbi:MAG: hypothetical protein H6R40_954 [Gemmatimonadetes bacterium]|nr:hypothetical protein [Gemmatimonadota bacterium]